MNRDRSSQPDPHRSPPTHERDDYLWRADGPRDPEIERLEEALARFRYRPVEPAAPAGIPASRPSRARRLAAAAVLVVAAGTVWFVLTSRPDRAFAWAIELTAGTIYVDSGLGVRTNRFEIATTFGIVRDIGTQFEVSSSPAELRLRVREGLVQLYQDGPRAELSGVAGEQVRIDSFGAIDRASFSTYDPEWAWASALADVPETDGQPLLGFLSWVARETGRALRFQPGAEAQAQITILHGSADNLAPLDALEVMLKTTDFRYELQDSGVLWIERRRAP